MSEEKKVVYIAEIWLKAWCAAVTGGHGTRGASKYADACITDIKKRFGDKEEETE